MPETLDDKFLADKKKEQDEFDDAFDEIEGKDPELHKALHGDDALLNKDETKGDALKPDTGTTPGDDGAVAKDKPVAQVDNTDAAVNTDLFDGLKKEDIDASASATGEQGTDSKDVEISELKAQLNAEQNKTSSWDGRIKAANKRAEEAEAKNAEFEQRLKTLEGGTAAVETDKPGDKNEAIAKFFSDFPEFEAPIRALIAEGNTGNTGVTLDEVKEAIKPDLDEVKSAVTETSSQDTFMRGLRANHADVQTYIDNGAILKWIDLQPAYIAKELTRVYSGGTVDEATTLVDEFKRTSSEYKPNKPEHTTVKNDKLNSMMEVDSDSAGPPAGEPDKDNYDEAADEAFKED